MKLLTISLMLIQSLVESSSSNLRNSLEGRAANSRKLQEKRKYCPTGRRTEKTYSILPDGDRYTETSYIVHSHQKDKGDDVVWVGSDGKQNTISAVNLKTGKTIHTCLLENVSKRKADWESVALGPCDAKKKDVCIFVGNIGDNKATSCKDRKCTRGKDQLSMFKFKEPSIKKRFSRVRVTTLVFDYRDGGFPTNFANSEAMLVDFEGDDDGGKAGDIFVITKNPQNPRLQRLGKIAVGEHEGRGTGVYRVKMRPVGGLSLNDAAVTGADMTRDGHVIAVRTRKRVYFYPRSPSQSVSRALREDYCDFQSKTKLGGNAQQFEAVAMVGEDMLECSECLGKTRCKVDVTLHSLKYDNR